MASLLASCSLRNYRGKWCAYTSNGVDASAEIHPKQSLQAAVDDQKARTVAFQDSYDSLTPSSSSDEGHRDDPQYLVGYQEDPHLKECQRQQQRAGR